MLTDRQQLVEARFRTLLLKWLGSLPTDGWEGTSHELGDALYASGEWHRLSTYVPLCPGRQMLQLAGFLKASGYIVTHRRTKRARTLRFTRLGLTNTTG